MESIDTIEILRRWYNESPEIIGNIVEKLNVHGLVSDECGFGISSTMVEKWDDRCSQFLENCGYDGGRLAKTGKYIDGYGSVYVVFDSDDHTPDSALKVIERQIEPADF